MDPHPMVKEIHHISYRTEWTYKNLKTSEGPCLRNKRERATISALSFFI